MVSLKEEHLYKRLIKKQRKKALCKVLKKEAVVLSDFNDPDIER